MNTIMKNSGYRVMIVWERQWKENLGKKEMNGMFWLRLPAMLFTTQNARLRVLLISGHQQAIVFAENVMRGSQKKLTSSLMSWRKPSETPRGVGENQIKNRRVENGKIYQEN